jgi:pyridoxine/pyridoxamine 5'-phosphate oxidase
VLRDFDGGLAIFVNATSPKWPYLRAGSCAVLTYWPSVQVQYRLQARTEPLPASSVAASWQLRPDSPKRMDWLYEQVAGQSTPIDSRDALLAHFEATELPDPLVASPSAMGLFLQPESVERLDLTQSNGVHDRRRYVRDDGQWREQTLIP